jgi:hypothetical protein
MPLYLASYDIQEKHHDEYQELWDYFDQLKAVKILYSEYAVPFPDGAMDLAKKINNHLRPNDRLLVCELFNGDPIAWSSLLIETAAFQNLLTNYARALN